MATNILLVRHGQTNSNVKEFYMGWSKEDLNETGYSQVRRLAARLAKQAVNAIYTSPLQRALTTADIIAEPHKLTPVTDRDLIEINLGDWEGLHVSDIKQKWAELFAKWRSDPSDVAMPGGESMAQLTERAAAVLNRIVTDNPDRTVILVTHEIIIKVIIPRILGCSNTIYRHFRIDNASLSVITEKDGVCRLQTLNDTAHLNGI